MDEAATEHRRITDDEGIHDERQISHGLIIVHLQTCVSIAVEVCTGSCTAINGAQSDGKTPWWKSMSTNLWAQSGLVAIGNRQARECPQI